MKSHRLAIPVLVLVLAMTCGCAGKNATEYKGPPLPGEYRVIAPYQRTVDSLPEVVEVFSFESEACYRLNAEFEKLEKRYEKRARFRSYPIFWGDQSPFATKLYFVAELADRGQNVRRALFAAKFEKGEDLGDQAVIARIAVEYGLADLYAAKVFAREINDRVDEANELVKNYGLTATPSVVVNRSLLVTPAIAGGTVDDMVGSLKTMLAGIVGW